MARFDGMMLWTDDFLADTTALDKGEVGSYILLLLAAWRTKTGTLPDDDKMLARMARCSPHEWKRMRPLMLRFFEIVNQEWQQPRLLREREAVERRSISAKESASRGWVNRKNPEASQGGKSLENHKSDDANAVRSGSDRNAPVSVSVSVEERRESKTPQSPPVGGPSVGLFVGEDLPPPATKKAKDPLNGHQADFEKFYAAYPRKEDRGLAIAEYAKAIKVAPPAVILAGLMRQLPSLLEQQPNFRFKPAKWLHAQAWANGEPQPQREREAMLHGSLG